MFFFFLTHDTHLYLNGSNVGFSRSFSFPIFFALCRWLFSSFGFFFRSFHFRLVILECRFLMRSFVCCIWLGQYGHSSNTTETKINNDKSVWLVFFLRLSKNFTSNHLGIPINPRQRPTLLQATRAATAFTTSLALPGGYTYVFFVFSEKETIKFSFQIESILIN